MGVSAKKGCTSVLVGAWLAAVSTPVWSQSREIGPEPLPAPRWLDEEPMEQEELLPPVPVPAEPPPEAIDPRARFVLREVRFRGNRAISDSALERIVAPYLGQVVTGTDLLALRDAVTRMYIARGYVTSGALLPDQDIEDGVLLVEVVEGRVERLEIETDGRMRSSILASTLRSVTKGAANVHEIEAKLQSLRRSPEIDTVQARLLASDRLGESVLRVRFEEGPIWRGFIEAGNDLSPALGSWKGEASGLAVSPLGFGERLSARFAGGEGLQQVEGLLALPVIPLRSWVELHARRSWSEVVDSPFDRLDIEGRVFTAGLTYRHELIQRMEYDLTAYVTGEWRRTRSFLDGRDFDFTAGTSNGRATVTALRFGGEGGWRTRWTAAAVRSTLSVGVDALDASVQSGGVPDGRFVAWLGQARVSQRLGLLDAQLQLRGDVQLSNDPLLGIEQLGVGGIDSVRGYRRNARVRDNGVVGSAELLVPLPTWRRVSPEALAFVDGARAWDVNSDLSNATLLSVGGGLRVGMGEHLMFEIYYGEALRDVTQPNDDDLQDEGVHLRVTLRLP